MPPVGTLGELTRAAFVRAAAAQATLGDVLARAADRRPARSLAAALRGHSIGIIAEVKRASPSKGAIAPGLKAAERAAQYVAGGAVAISVLTEPSRFGGSLQDLSDVSASVEVPVIRKDFIVAPIQIWEARAAGASAVLLIVRALSPDALPRLVDCAREAGLAVLVEVRDEEELARALLAGATIVGVNNRNLETLIIDRSTAPRIIQCIPSACVAVAESGMQRVEDIIPAANAGADAVLVGSAVSASAHPAEVVSALSGVPRQPR